VHGYQLSPQQRRQWLLHQQAGASSRQACGLVDVEGPLDSQILRAAIQAVVDRHEILRTRFRLLPGMPMPLQTVAEGERCVFCEQDLRGLSAAECAARVEQAWDQLRDARGDLEQGPAMHATLLRRSADSHTLVFALPALCADAATVTLLVENISRHYAAIQRGEDVGPAPIQYADVAEVFNELLASSETEAGRDYWRARLAGARLAFQLPFENTAAALPPFALAHVPVCLGEPLQDRVNATAAEAGVSASTLLLACWLVLLWRLTGERQFTVGATLDGRTYEGLDAALGVFERSLPLPCEIPSGASIAELCRQVDRARREMSEWQDYFDAEEFFGASGSTREMDGRPSPYFRLSFTDRAGARTCHAGGVNWRVLRHAIGGERFTLRLVCSHDEDALTLHLEYDAARFSAAATQSFARQLLALITSAVERPNARVEQLEVVRAAERQLLVREFNRTDADFPRDRCLHQLFEDQVGLMPDAVAVVHEASHVTYRVLDAQANRLAHDLSAAGLRRGDVAAICMESGPELLVAMLGTLKAGGAYLPLDPRHPRGRLAFMLDDARAAVLLTQHRMRPRLPDDAKWVVDVDGESPAARPAQAPHTEVGADDLCYVIYTSGSTGKPKGTMVPHRAVVNYLSWCVGSYEVERGSGAPVHSSVAWDLTVTSLFAPLLAGRAAVLAPEPQGLDALVELLRRHTGFSLVKITPAHLAGLNQLLSPEWAAGRARRLIVGGEALPGASLAFWQRHAPETRIVNEYGPTETVVGCCVHEARADDAVSGNVPIGRPIANTALFVLDADGELAPIGAPGELYIAGAGLAWGYLGRPDLTAEKFVPHTFATNPGDRLYRTGDVARYLPDGTLECLGRIDHQVKLRGHRIELGEIEACLRRHAGVADAVVLLRQDGTGESCLVGYAVPRPGAQVAVPALRASLLDHLPDYMVPGVLMMLDRLPLTANGKVDRDALPALGPGAAAPTEGSVAASRPVEEIVAGIWSEVLRRPAPGVHDNFFHLGGHSLLATQVVSRVRQAFGVEVPLHSLFERPTIRELAASIDALRGAAGVAVPPVERRREQGDVPLSFAQRRLWFLSQWHPDNSDYNITTVVRLEGRLAVAALRATFGEIVRRHEILRTRFVQRDSGPVQVIDGSDDVPIPVVDLEEWAPTVRDAVARALAAAAARRPFDLGRGPLLRVVLLRLAANTHVLVCTLHHIVSDGWSAGVLVREFATLYRASLAG
jgi:amino acid adenylation domain-containing protein